MDDGSRKSFKTEEDGSSAYGYALLDFDPSTHMFTVGDLGVDSGTLFSIDGRSGRRLDFGPAYPSYSPTTRFVLTENGHDPNSQEPTRFEILDASDAKPNKVWSATAGKGTIPEEATFGAWEFDDTLRLDDARAEAKKPPVLAAGLLTRRSRQAC